jgi:hypothetical protein
LQAALGHLLAVFPASVLIIHAQVRKSAGRWLHGGRRERDGLVSSSGQGSSARRLRCRS